MNWLDFIGIGLILPTVVALISYILTDADNRIFDLHQRIIKRLLSFRQHRDEQSFQTIMSLSLGEALKEIEHILTGGKSSQEDILRIDVAYNMDEQRKSVLINLKDELEKLRRRKKIVWSLIIFVIIIYVVLKITFKAK